MVEQDDLLHRGRKIEVLRCHVKDTVEHEFELLRRPVLFRLHEREEILLHERAGDLRKVQMPERRTQVDLKHTGVFLERGRLGRLFFEFEPVLGIIRKENGFGSPSLGICNGDILYLGLPDEFLDEFLFHRVEVFGSDLDVISLPAVAGLEQSLIIAELYDSVVIDKRLAPHERNRLYHIGRIRLRTDGYNGLHLHYKLAEKVNNKFFKKVLGGMKRHRWMLAPILIGVGVGLSDPWSGW